MLLRSNCAGIDFAGGRPAIATAKKALSNYEAASLSGLFRELLPTLKHNLQMIARGAETVVVAKAKAGISGIESIVSGEKPFQRPAETPTYCQQHLRPDLDLPALSR